MYSRREYILFSLWTNRLGWGSILWFHYPNQTPLIPHSNLHHILATIILPVKLPMRAVLSGDLLEIILEGFVLRRNTFRLSLRGFGFLWFERVRVKSGPSF